MTLLHFLIRFVGSTAAAEDVFQELFSKFTFRQRLLTPQGDLNRGFLQLQRTKVGIGTVSTQSEQYCHCRKILVGTVKALALSTLWKRIRNCQMQHYSTANKKTAYEMHRQRTSKPLAGDSVAELLPTNELRANCRFTCKYHLVL